MTNKQQYVERKKYKKEQIYDAIAKRIREICDLTDSVTSAECLKNTLLRMGYKFVAKTHTLACGMKATFYLTYT